MIIIVSGGGGDGLGMGAWTHLALPPLSARILAQQLLQQHPATMHIIDYSGVSTVLGVSQETGEGKGRGVYSIGVKHLDGAKVMT